MPFQNMPWRRGETLGQPRRNCTHYGLAYDGSCAYSMQLPAVRWVVSTAYLKSFKGTYLDWNSLSGQVFIQLLPSASALERNYQIWIRHQLVYANSAS